MSISKEEALKKLDAIEKEQKELRAIIEAPEKPTSLKDACRIKGINYENFLQSIAGLSKNSRGFEKLQVICGAVRGNWKPTSENIWHYPYFKRNKSGLSFRAVDYYNVGDFIDVPASLTLENSADAEYVGKTFEAEWNEYLSPE